MFIDTGAFFARYRNDDDSHNAAVLGWEKIGLVRTLCLTTDLVVAEALTLLAAISGQGLQLNAVERFTHPNASRF